MNQKPVYDHPCNHVTCDFCLAGVGMPCVSKRGKPIKAFHVSRRQRANKKKIPPTSMALARPIEPPPVIPDGASAAYVRVPIALVPPELVAAFLPAADAVREYIAGTKRFLEAVDEVLT